MGNMIKWIRNNIVEVHVSVIILCVVAFGFYGVHVRQYRMYKEYNDMKGVVTAVLKSKHYVMIHARLDNGVSGSANVGYTHYEVGDVYINRVGYSRILGTIGTAYFISPPRAEALGVLESIIVVITYFGVTVYGVLKYVIWLIERHEKYNR